MLDDRSENRKRNQMQQLFFDPFSHGNGNKKEKACKQLAHQTKETRKQHLHSPCSSFSQHPFVCVAVFPRASAAHNLHFFFCNVELPLLMLCTTLFRFVFLLFFRCETSHTILRSINITQHSSQSNLLLKTETKRWNAQSPLQHGFIP